MTVKVKKTIDKTKVALKAASDSTKTYIKEYPTSFNKKTPKWAKRMKWVGIILTGMGPSLAAAPIAIPAWVLWMVGTGGSLSALIAQGFKES